MLIGGELSPRAKELYDKLYTKEFDSEALFKELEKGVYNADVINHAAINYISDCCLECKIKPVPWQLNIVQ